MSNQVQDFYKAMLEKRAECGDWGSSTDPQEVANGELSSNQGDQRSQLSDLFAQASSAQKEDTKLVGKALPKARAGDSASSNPLLKVGAAFFAGLREGEILKTASPDYLHAAYTSFKDELDKIAWAGAKGSVLHKALQAAKKPVASKIKKPAASKIKQVGGGRGAGVWQLG